MTSVIGRKSALSELYPASSCYPKLKLPQLRVALGLTLNNSPDCSARATAACIVTQHSCLQVERKSVMLKGTNGYPKRRILTVPTSPYMVYCKVRRSIIGACGRTALVSFIVDAVGLILIQCARAMWFDR